MTTAATERKVTYCRICEPLCGLVATVEDGRLVSLRPDQDHPLSKGFACPKGIAFTDVQNDPDRVLHPLRRTPSGEFERVSWDEALDDIAARLKRTWRQHGGSSVGQYFGNPGGFSYATALWVGGFFGALGATHQYSPGSQDINSRFVASRLLYGALTQLPFPDLPRTDFLLMLGANPLVSHGSAVHAPRMKDQLSAIVDRGGRVVVIDPRRTETARAFEHMAVRPDTDAWLLLSLLHVIFAEGLDDAAALAAQTTGVDLLRRASGCALARGHRADHRRAGRDRARAGPRLRGRTERRRLRPHRVLPGSARHAGRLPARRAQHRHRQPRPARRHALHPRGHPCAGAGRARRHGDLRQDPLPDRRLPRRARHLPRRGDGRGDHHARARVSCGRCSRSPATQCSPSPTARGSRPRCSSSTCMSRSTSTSTRPTSTPTTCCRARPSWSARTTPTRWPSPVPVPFVQSTEAVLEAYGEARPEWQVFDELARRMGLALFATGPLAQAMSRPLVFLNRRGIGRLTPRKLMEALLRLGPYGDRFGLRRGGLNPKKLRANPHGIVLAEHAPTGILRSSVRHSDHLVHLDPPEIAAELDRLGEGYDEDPAYPLRLIGLRELRSQNSWMHNSATLMSGKGRRHSARVNPADATAAGLVDGDPVRIRSRHGEIETLALVTDEVGPGTVAVPHGWGHEGGSWELANKAGGANVNRLASTKHQDIERVAGMSHLNGIPVCLEVVP